MKFVAKKTTLFLLSLVLLFIAGACKKSTTFSGPEVTLTIAGNMGECRAIEVAASAFKKKYPNVTIVYETIQGTYADGIKGRALAEGDDRIDMYITTSNIQKGHALLDYALDLKKLSDLDLSEAYPGLINNYMFIEEDGSAPTKLYSIPLGAQMRGLFVNLTLLKSVGIDNAPTNQEELLAACAKLKEEGYLPFHGDPSAFAQQLLYPWICNSIVNSSNYEESFNLVNEKNVECIELFRDTYEFLYTLVENDYYDFYTGQKVLGLCKDYSNDGLAKSFMNIEEIKDAEGLGTDTYEKIDDIGQIAFLPNAISLGTVIQQYKEDYESEIEFVFVPAPVGENGGFVYLSPADAIAINPNTEKLEWVVKFFNFLFTTENNEIFATNYSIMPNTVDVVEYSVDLYDVPATNISDVGKATFKWSFYKKITGQSSKDLEDPSKTMALPAISKANHPDYLNPETGEMYPFEYFWDKLEVEFPL